MNLSLNAQKCVRHYDRDTKIAYLDMHYMVKHFKNFVVYKKVRSSTTYYLRKIDLRKGFNAKSFLFELMIPEEQAKALIGGLRLAKVSDPLKDETDVFYYAPRDVEAKIAECKREVKLLEANLESAKTKLRFWEGVV